MRKRYIPNPFGQVSRRRRPFAPQRRRAAVLVLVLVVFAVLSLLSLGLCHRVRLDLMRDRMQAEDLQSYYLALGGLQRAMAALAEGSQAQEEGPIDHFGSPWHLRTTAREEGFFQEQPPAWLSRTQLYYRVTDEEGRLNVNTSSPAGWMHLPSMTEPILYAIVDWQDTDDQACPQGAESVYYQRSPLRHAAKNAPITVIWELALVKDVAWPLLCGRNIGGGPSWTQSETGDMAGQAADADTGRPERGLIDYFTVYGDGKVNLNTADFEVLSSLPDIGTRTAQAIVGYRAGPDGVAFTPDDAHFKSFKQLARVPGLTPYHVELLEQYGTFGSTHFRIVSEATLRPGGRPCRLIATARRGQDGVKLVLIRRDS